MSLHQTQLEISLNDRHSPTVIPRTPKKFCGASTSTSSKRKLLPLFSGARRDLSLSPARSSESEEDLDQLPHWMYSSQLKFGFKFKPCNSSASDSVSNHSDSRSKENVPPSKQCKESKNLTSSCGQAGPSRSGPNVDSRNKSTLQVPKQHSESRTDSRSKKSSPPVSKRRKESLTPIHGCSGHSKESKNLTSSCGQSGPSRSGPNVDSRNKSTLQVPKQHSESRTDSRSKKSSPPVSKRRKESLTPIHGCSGHSKDTVTTVGDRDESLLRQILKEVKTSTQSFDQRLSELEQKITDLCEEDTGLTIKKKKVSPSPEVRNVVRKVYRALTEADDSYGWNQKETFRSPVNRETTQKLVSDSKVQLPDTPSALIKDAARTYFVSIAGSERLRSTGKYSEKCTQQRRRNRLLRKLKRRQTTFINTTALPDSDKPKLQPCITLELMSSEESYDEDDCNDASFTVRPLPWRDDDVSDLFSSLDHKYWKRQSRRSRVMSFGRHRGLPSDRPRPLPGSIPAWTLK